ncbi:hypothetical protein Tco_0564052 [Tanacetum coccineum]
MQQKESEELERREAIKNLFLRGEYGNAKVFIDTMWGVGFIVLNDLLVCCEGKGLWSWQNKPSKVYVYLAIKVPCGGFNFGGMTRKAPQKYIEVLHKVSLKGLTKPAEKLLGIKDAPSSQISALGSFLSSNQLSQLLGFSATPSASNGRA